MSIVDPIILIWIGLATIRGRKLGLFRLVGSSLGTLIGLFIGTRIAANITQDLPSAASRLIAATALLTTVSAAGMAIGDFAGLRLSKRAYSGLMPVIRYGGAVFNAVFVLAVVWLIAAPLGNVATYSIGARVRQSLIVRSLYTVLPLPPDVVNELEHTLGPNGLPSAFVGNEPHHAPINIDVTIPGAVLAAAEKSVFRVIGEGCNGAVQGSGFVVQKETLLTNAHVVAGIAKPYVYDGTAPYPAETVYFDPALDVALLHVPGLNANTLPQSPAVEPDSEPIVAMGYPANGPLTNSGGYVIDHIRAIGRTIYDKGRVTREIYEIQASVAQGDSGGPVINKSGAVIGLMFGKSVSNESVGYAMTMKQLDGVLHGAPMASSSPVSTGPCIGG